VTPQQPVHFPKGTNQKLLERRINTADLSVFVSVGFGLGVVCWVFNWIQAFKIYCFFSGFSSVGFPSSLALPMAWPC
jgi:hypothetical protein